MLYSYACKLKTTLSKKGTSPKIHWNFERFITINVGWHINFISSKLNEKGVLCTTNGLLKFRKDEAVFMFIDLLIQVDFVWKIFFLSFHASSDRLHMCIEHWIWEFLACETGRWVLYDIFPNTFRRGNFRPNISNSRGKLHQVSMIRIFFFLLIYSGILPKQNKTNTDLVLLPFPQWCCISYCLHIIYGMHLLSHISINYPMSDAKLSGDLGILAQAGKRTASKESSTNILPKQKQWPVCVYGISLYLVNLHWISHILQFAHFWMLIRIMEKKEEGKGIFWFRV